ncbi:hypothetical protein Vafri_430, partial [Volvox africanus]
LFNANSSITHSCTHSILRVGVVGLTSLPAPALYVGGSGAASNRGPQGCSRKAVQQVVRGSIAHAGHGPGNVNRVAGAQASGARQREGLNLIPEEKEKELRKGIEKGRVANTGCEV